MKIFTFIVIAALPATLAAGASAPAPDATRMTTSVAVLIRASDPGIKYLAAEYARDLSRRSFGPATAK